MRWLRTKFSLGHQQLLKVTKLTLHFSLPVQLVYLLGRLPRMAAENTPHVFPRHRFGKC